MPSAPPRSIPQLLFEITRLIGRRLRVQFEGTGLHHGQALVLVRLWHGDGLPQSELARDLYLRAPTVTRMLRRMERAGWITRRPDDDDRRISRVDLTEKARALREDVDAAFAELERELLGGLAAEDRERLRTLLESVRTRAIAMQETGSGTEHPSGAAP
jgi:DNA-binding MarR family transcriptional regulator